MNDKIGRNDLCPCGSGKKHKKCCITVHAPHVEVADFAWHQLRKLEGTVVDDHLMPYAIRELPRDMMVLAMSDLLREDLPEEMDRELLLHNFILPYFLFDWISAEDFDVPDFDGEATIAENYVKAHSSRLNSREKRFLELMKKTYYSFYSVLEVEPERSLTVKDVFLGTTHHIKERQGTRQLKRGDIVFSRILTMDDQSIFVGMAPFSLPIENHVDLIDFKQWLIEEIAVECLTVDTLRDGVELEVMDYFFDAVIDAFNQPMPTLTNTDGDLFQFCTSHFELTLPPENALYHLLPLTLAHDPKPFLEEAKRDEAGNIIHLEFAWLKKGNKRHKDWTVMGYIILEPGKLMLETNSKERATTGQKVIEKKLGKAILFQHMLIESPESKVASLPYITQEDREKQEAFMALPEVQAQLTAMAQAHWKAWFDQPIPALDHQTPRQAAKTPVGREKLEALLLQYERHNAEHGYNNPLKTDIHYLRTELALD